MKQIKVKSPTLQRWLDAVKPWHIAVAWLIAIVMVYIASRL